MTTTLINRDSFIQTGEIYSETLKGGYVFSYTPGTIEVTLRGKTQRVEARLFADGDIRAKGLVGRYQTGGKVWPASVSSRISAIDGKVIEQAHFGRYDNHPKFRKENCLWFA